jgi:hypothetical protein
MLAHHHQVLQRIFQNILGWISCQHIHQHTHQERINYFSSGQWFRITICIVDSRNQITSWHLVSVITTDQMADTTKICIFFTE